MPKDAVNQHFWPMLLIAATVAVDRAAITDARNHLPENEVEIEARVAGAGPRLSKKTQRFQMCQFGCQTDLLARPRRGTTKDASNPVFT